MNKYTSNTINNKNNNNNGTCVYNNDDGGVKNNDGNGNTKTCNQNANRKEKRQHVDRHITGTMDILKQRLQRAKSHECTRYKHGEHMRAHHHLNKYVPRHA